MGLLLNSSEAVWIKLHENHKAAYKLRDSICYDLCIILNFKTPLFYIFYTFIYVTLFTLDLDSMSQLQKYWLLLIKPSRKSEGFHISDTLPSPSLG